MASKNPSDGYYHISDNSPKVPMALFAENRKRLAAALRESGNGKSVVLLQGGEEQGLCAGDSADVSSVFQQEAFFHWVGFPSVDNVMNVNRFVNTSLILQSSGHRIESCWALGFLYFFNLFLLSFTSGVSLNMSLEGLRLLLCVVKAIEMDA